MAVSWNGGFVAAGAEVNVATRTIAFSTVGARSALLVVVTYGVAASVVTSATIGGVACALVGEASDSVTEPGNVQVYFLDNIAQGASTNFIYNRTNNATVSLMSGLVFNAAAATEVYVPGIVLLNEEGAYAEQNVSDGSPGTNSLRAVLGYYGGNTPAPVGANTTSVGTNDQTSFGFSAGRETTAGQGSRPVGLAQATADDRAAVHLAIRETPAALPYMPKGKYVSQAVQRSVTRCKGILVPDHKLWRPKLWMPGSEAI